MRYEKEVAWKFFGEKQKAQQYTAQARVVAGELLNANVNELEQVTRRVQLAEDVWCQVRSIPGQVIIELHATTTTPEEPDGKIAGFILKASDSKEGILSWDKVTETWKWIPRAQLTELAYGNVVSWKDTTRAISCNAAPERHFYDDNITWNQSSVFLNGKALPEVDALVAEEGSALGAGYYEGWLYVIVATNYWPYNISVFAQEKPGGAWERSDIYNDFLDVTSAAVFSEDGSEAVVRMSDYYYKNYSKIYYHKLLRISFSSTGSADGDIAREDTAHYTSTYITSVSRTQTCDHDYYESDPPVDEHITAIAQFQDWYGVNYSGCTQNQWWEWGVCWIDFPIVYMGTDTGRIVPGHPNLWEWVPGTISITGIGQFHPEVIVCSDGVLPAVTGGAQGYVERYWYGGVEHRYKACNDSGTGQNTLTQQSDLLIAQEVDGYLTAGIIEDREAWSFSSTYNYHYEFQNGMQRWRATGEFLQNGVGAGGSLNSTWYYGCVDWNCCSNGSTTGTYPIYHDVYTTVACDNRRDITTHDASASSVDTWGYKIAANGLGTVADASYNIIENDSGSCYTRTEYDCEEPAYCAGCEGGDTTDNSASFNDSWSSDSTIIFTIGYDARCGAWLRAECTYFKQESDEDGSVIAGEGSSQIKLRLPTGEEVLIAEVPVAIAWGGDKYAYDSYVSCSGSGNGFYDCLRCDRYHTIGSCSCVSECLPANSPYNCGYSNSGSRTYADEVTPTLFPRYSLFDKIGGGPWLSGGIVSKWNLQSNADIIESRFQCNQDTFGHWMISVYLKIQEFIIVDYYYTQEVGDPIYVSYNWLSTGQNPAALVGVTSDETHPAYFENVSVTGPRKK